MYILGLKQKNFCLRKVFIYDWNFKNKNIAIVKYYLIDLVLQYNFLVVYSIIHIIHERKIFFFTKKIATKFIYFLFLFIFGFPVFFLKIIHKIYDRLNNSVLDNTINRKLFLINCNSMFFFDYKDTYKIEKMNIKIENKKLNFDMQL